MSNPFLQLIDPVAVVKIIDESSELQQLSRRVHAMDELEDFPDSSVMLVDQILAPGTSPEVHERAREALRQRYLREASKVLQKLRR